MTIVYRYGNTYYINMTNRCPCRCVFCVRDCKPRLGDADSLWLTKEPTVEEIMDELRSKDLSCTDEIVFCGYGEPTERFDDLKRIAGMIHSELGKKVRLDTNGLGCLVNGRDIVSEMVGLIDAVSISLNAPEPEEYLEITRSRFGVISHNEVVSFIRRCTSIMEDVTVSVVGGSITSESEKKCAIMAKEMGVYFRVR